MEFKLGEIRIGNFRIGCLRLSIVLVLSFLVLLALYLKNQPENQHMNKKPEDTKMQSNDDSAGETEETIPALIKALGDKNDEVRKSATQALADIGEKAVPALVKALTAENSIERPRFRCKRSSNYYPRRDERKSK